MSRQVSDYLVCYDIADPKRLSKLARILEKRAYRIQYSIFLLKKVANHEISSLVNETTAIIDKEADDVRIYKIKSAGYRLGCAIDIDNPYTWTEE